MSIEKMNGFERMISYAVSVKKEKLFRCPFCRDKFKFKSGVYNHIKIEHQDIIKSYPEGTSISQIYFDNKKGNIGRPHKCVICKVSDVTWNETTEKYNRFCSDRCIKIARERAKANHIKKHGVDTKLKDPEHQRMMMNNRRISREYIFEDGGKIMTNSSYEYDFLTLCDKTLHITSAEVIQPMDAGIFFIYEKDGEEHKYIPDFYLISFNLIIEIKHTGSDNPHKQDVKDLIPYKDAVVMNSGKYNYARITNKDYEGFLKLLEEIKAKNLDEKNEGDKTFVFYIGAFSR